MRNKQRVTIAALVVAIIGLSIGFAAFSNVLNINSTASVNPDASSLKVVFAKNHFSQQVTTISQLDTSAVAPYSASTGASGGNATINNEAQNGPTLTGLQANFTAPGQNVVYKLNVVNAGKLKAYLTDIVFGTTGSPAKAVSCAAATVQNEGEEATPSLVDAACEGISISVKIGDLDAKTASGSLNNLELDVADYEEVIITISYANGAAYVDGPMNVAFGDIEINAASVGAQSQGGGGQQTPSTADFVSYEQGVLSKYYGSSTNIVIPNGLSLPVTTVTATPNQQKCEANYPVQYLQENQTVADACQSFASALSGLGPDDIQNYINEGFDLFDVVTTESEPYLITSIDSSAFSGSTISSLSIGNSITTIGNNAFSGRGITTLDLSGATSLTTISNSAFSHNNITSVTIPSSVTSIEFNAFNNAGLNSIDLSNATNLTTIGRQAFLLNNLTSVTIPSSVTEIEEAAFRYNLISSITIGDSVNGSNITYIGPDSFLPNSGTTIESVIIYRSSNGVTVSPSAFPDYSISGSWHPVS